MHPQAGNVTEHSGKSSSHKEWAVFQVQEARSYLTGNAHHFAPEAGAFAVNSCASACAADVLAGESSADDINVSSPGAPVESAHVVPDREPRQDSVCLAAQEHGAAEGINFNSASGAPSNEVPSHDSASCPCKKCQLIHVITP
jgi:hypothetical protein